jgi:hypothetical protein
LATGRTPVTSEARSAEVSASVIPYPLIVVGFPDKELNAPSNASVIPYPAIVVGVEVRSANAPEVATVANPASAGV